MTKTFSQGESNLVNDPIDISLDTSLSLPETPSTPSVTEQIPSTTSPTNIPSQLDDRNRKLQGTNTPLRLVGNSLVAPPPLFGQNLDSNRRENWALIRLKFRHDIHKDIRNHNIHILTQHN